MKIDPIRFPKQNCPRLLPWLVEAAKGIDVIPLPYGPIGHRWGVLVHNGEPLDSESNVGTILTGCESELEAELVAASLWALLELNRLQEKIGEAFRAGGLEQPAERHGLIGSNETDHGPDGFPL